MKTVGIVRRIDSLGRVVLPIELRRMLRLEINDPVEISASPGKIVIQKHETACIFCGGEDGLSDFHGKKLCKKCRAELQ